MPSLIASLRTLSFIGRVLGRVLGALPLTPSDDPEASALVGAAEDARRAGRREEARRLYRQAVERRKNDVRALRGLRDLTVEMEAWLEALGVEERLIGIVAGAERSAETTWLATIHYELGRADTRGGRPASAIGHFKNALKAEPGFVPAALALGDALEAGGDAKEAIKTWERTAEQNPTLAVLARLERVYRQEGRPSRMIALYRAAVDRAPDDLALAVALGRVYFELEMLDEAADQFEKIEVRAPDLPVVHAFLGAVFERRGETREAFAEYRRALRLGDAFDWPHACTACGAPSPAWQDRCPRCRRWNTVRPAPPRR